LVSGVGFALYRIAPEGAAGLELNEELGSHLEMLVKEKVREGMSPKAAPYAALRNLSCLEQAKVVYRAQRRLPMIETCAVNKEGQYLAKRPRGNRLPADEFSH
jgi:hypothetical protein